MDNARRGSGTRRLHGFTQGFRRGVVGERVGPGWGGSSRLASQASATPSAAWRDPPPPPGRRGARSISVSMHRSRRSHSWSASHSHQIEGSNPHEAPSQTFRPSFQRSSTRASRRPRPARRPATTQRRQRLWRGISSLRGPIIRSATVRSSELTVRREVHYWHLEDIDLGAEHVRF